MKKLLKILGLSLFSIVMLAVAAVLCVLKWPELLLNDRNLDRAPYFAKKAGINLHWDQGHIHVESQAWLRKRVSLDFTGICVQMEANHLHACFERAQLTAAASLAGFKPRITELGPIHLEGGRIYAKPDMEAANSTPPQDEANPPLIGSSSIMPEFFVGTRIFPMSVGIDHFEVVSGASAVTGKLSLNSELDLGGQAHVKAKVDASALGSGSPKPNKIHASLKMENPQGFWTLDTWKVGANAVGSLSDGTDLKVKAQVDPKGHGAKLAFAYSVDGSYKKAKGHATVRATGIASPDKIEAHLAATAQNLVPALESVWVHDCDLTLARQSSELEPGSVKLGCPVGMRVPLPPKGFPNLKIPTEVGMRVDADLKTGTFPPAPDALVDGKVTVQLDPILTPLFEGHGKVDTVVYGVPTEYPQGLKMDTSLGLTLKIPHFEQMVEQLRNTPLDVWAPLRVLRGEMNLALKGRFDANSGTAPVTLTTRMESNAQKLNLDASGTVTLEHLQPQLAAHLDMDVALSQVQVELPPLPALPSVGHFTPDPLPRYFPDGRIHKAIGIFEKKPKSQFSYNVRVHTTDEGHPVKLLTTSAQAPIPLSVNLTLNDVVPPSGSIRVQQFPMELFRRNVRLDHLTVNLKTPSDDSELSGEIIVPYTDYTITILLVGTTSKPLVRFMSEPPQSEDKIYATLIFGKPLEALDPDQARSVGASRAALYEGAFSLGSLYLLSSFNIENVDFNPDTKTVSLKYRLGEGTSLNISEGSGENSVGIRKRLTKHISVSTALNNPSTSQTDRTLSTFLEWAYQY